MLPWHDGTKAFKRASAAAADLSAAVSKPTAQEFMASPEPWLRCTKPLHQGSEGSCFLCPSGSLIWPRHP